MTVAAFLLRALGIVTLLASWALPLPCRADDQPWQGLVIDAQTRQPVALAHVAAGDTRLRSDDEGRFVLPADAHPETLAVRAPGYRAYLGKPPTAQPALIELHALQPKGLYLSAYGIGSSVLRGQALALIEATELNTLVIDVRGDTGMVPYRSDTLARHGLPQKIVTVRDMPALMKDLKARGIYLIARIVAFKDDVQASAHPEWAVKTSTGQRWLDREGLAWLDASNPRTWQLAMAMAEEAAALGFDEIQFDYVRFPDARGLRFSQPMSQETRSAAISTFLSTARQRLPAHVYLSADIFGYVCWNTNDTDIGQQLEMLSDRLDYLSPMLYPSGFTWGIPGHRMAVASPYEIVHHSLERAIERTGLPGVRWRPWLQAFRDYAFDHRPFGATAIQAQIQAAQTLQTHGWLLWNAGNHYTDAGLSRRQPARPVKSP